MQLDAIVTNGRFLTLDPQRPTATRLGVFDGTIVGLDEELDGLTAAAVYDLQGAIVLPGLHDAHHHLSNRGHELRRCNVSPATAPTLDALYAAIARFADDLPADAWVEAVGFDGSKLDQQPDREGLDAAAGGRPVWMLHASHHSGVLSTGAIRRLGYDDPRQLPDVDHGWVERRPDGDPTGVIAERALALVHDVIRPDPFEAHVEAIRLGAAAALADGLTSVTEPGIAGQLTGNSSTDLAAFQAARDRGHLGFRVTVLPELGALHELAVTHPDDAGGTFGLDLGLRSGLGDDHLRVGGVKVFTDGALTARTAALREPYLDQPENRGLLLDDAEVLHEQIVAAHRAGWQVASHAIGDAAVDVALDAYEAAQRDWPRPDARHRIEHAGVVHDDQLARIARLGVVPVPQGRFLTELGNAYLTVLGTERSQLLYRQRSFLDAGVVVPGSSDCPVVDGAPLAGIEALVTRRLPDGSVLTPEERLTPLEAIRAFTTGSAYADRQEHRKGTLARGKLADLTVLADDPRTVEPTCIGAIEIVATVVGGEVRHGHRALERR
jgi:predicted amidohydrolase YtcJ